MKKQELLKQSIIKPCNCNICKLFESQHPDPLVYKILNSKFRARTLLGTTTYWVGCPRNIDAVPSSFEEMFDGLGEDQKIKVVYNLDLFKTKGGEV